MANDQRKSSEEVQEEIRQTRADLDQTIDALQNKLSPGDIVNEAVAYMQRGGGDFAANFGRAIRDNPLPVALVAVGLVWLVASSSRPPREERREYAEHRRREAERRRIEAYEKYAHAGEAYGHPEEAYGYPDASAYAYEEGPYAEEEYVAQRRRGRYAGGATPADVEEAARAGVTEFPTAERGEAGATVRHYGREGESEAERVAREGVVEPSTPERGEAAARHTGAIGRAGGPYGTQTRGEVEKEVEKAAREGVVEPSTPERSEGRTAEGIEKPGTPERSGQPRR